MLTEVFDGTFGKLFTCHITLHRKRWHPPHQMRDPQMWQTQLDIRQHKGTSNSSFRQLNLPRNQIWEVTGVKSLDQNPAAMIPPKTQVPKTHHFQFSQSQGPASCASRFMSWVFYFPPFPCASRDGYPDNVATDRSLNRPWTVILNTPLQKCFQRDLRVTNKQKFI